MSDRSQTHGGYFAHDWLTLREPLDHASRAHGLARQAARHLARTPGTHPLVVDLGSGAGSNRRYLTSFLPTASRWRLVDHDSPLLERAAALDTDPAHIEACQADLSGPMDSLLAGADLVTASALLDLVSHDWITHLAALVARERAATLISLSVDSRIMFAGRQDSDDAALLAALKLDQKRDKGLGMALGTAAPSAWVSALARCGYVITVMPADWWIDTRHGALAAMLLGGWAEAAARAVPEEQQQFQAWAGRRARDLAAGAATLSVGHIDVLGLPGPATGR